MKLRDLRSGLVVIALFFLFVGFFPEAMAGIWHLVNGRHRTIANSSIPVPLGWRGSFDNESPSFAMYAERGDVRTFFSGKSGAVILYSVTYQPRPAVSMANGFARQWALRDEISSKESKLIANVESTCVRHRAVAGPNLEVIQCFPNTTDGLEIDYSGDPAHVPEFFAILDAVKKTN